MHLSSLNRLILPLHKKEIAALAHYSQLPHHADGNGKLTGQILEMGFFQGCGMRDRTSRADTALGKLV